MEAKNGKNRVASLKKVAICLKQVKINHENTTASLPSFLFSSSGGLIFSIVFCILSTAGFMVSAGFIVTWISSDLTASTFFSCVFSVV